MLYEQEKLTTTSEIDMKHIDFSFLFSYVETCADTALYSYNMFTCTISTYYNQRQRERV